MEHLVLEEPKAYQEHAVFYHRPHDLSDINGQNLRHPAPERQTEFRVEQVLRGRRRKGNYILWHWRDSPSLELGITTVIEAQVDEPAGLTVYVLHEDNTESMVFDPQEIMEHGGLCGVDREEWEKSPQFHEKVMERQEHQQEREQAFLSQNRNCFAIYQVSCDDPQNMRFMNLDWLKSHDISIDRSNYDLIYTAPLSESGTVPEQLEKLYQQFNLEKPVDYHSPSMSVSDIVAIKQDGKASSVSR